MEKRFYKSRTDKKLAGVCAGIADYFEIDPTLVRLIWVVFTFAGGAGIIAYIIAAIVMPEAPETPLQSRAQSPPPREPQNDYRSNAAYEGTEIIEVDENDGPGNEDTMDHSEKTYTREEQEDLRSQQTESYGNSPSYGKEKGEDRNNFVIGAVLILIGAMFFSRNFFRWFWIDFSYIWPVVLILIGVVMIVNRRK